MLIHVSHQIINIDHVVAAHWENMSDEGKPKWKLFVRMVRATNENISQNGDTVYEGGEALALWGMLRGSAEHTNWSSEPPAEKVLA